MKPHNFKDLLKQTLTDHKLARSEKSQLLELIEKLQPDEQQLANFRSISFDLARDSIDSNNAGQIINWLEDVVKALRPRTNTQPAEVAEAWFSPRDNCPGQIRSLFSRVKYRADLCVFTITDDRLTSAIIDAHRRGVRIRIITDDDKATDLGSDADRFLQAGIALRTDRSEYHMHHKFAVFDGVLLLNGSYNWTRGAASNNEENIIVTSDSRLIVAFAAAFESLWEQVGSLST